MTYIPLLDGEECWASEVVDDTDSVITSLLELSKYCIQQNVSIENAMQLLTELNLHNDKHNIELDTEKWLIFCGSLSATAVAEMASDVEDKLNTYVAKYLTQKRK